MGIFGRGPDRTRALRDRRIQRLREDAPEEERGAILGTIPSLGAATAILSATLIGTSVVALGRVDALGGLRALPAVWGSAALLAAAAPAPAGAAAAPPFRPSA